jgi:hypothetical protein
MNITSKTVFLLVLSLFSLTINAQQRRIYFTELYGEFLGNQSVNQSGIITQVGAFGAGGQVSVGQEHISSVLSYNFRKINLKELNIPGASKFNIHEFMLGFRYFPMRPTFMTGNTALRITAGAQYGLDLDNNWRGLWFAGIVVSPIRAVTGLTLNFIYRPGTYPAGGYNMEPSWTIRASLLMGPSSE